MIPIPIPILIPIRVVVNHFCTTFKNFILQLWRDWHVWPPKHVEPLVCGNFMSREISYFCKKGVSNPSKKIGSRDPSKWENHGSRDPIIGHFSKNVDHGTLLFFTFFKMKKISRGGILVCRNICICKFWKPGDDYVSTHPYPPYCKFFHFEKSEK